MSARAVAASGAVLVLLLILGLAVKFSSVYVKDSSNSDDSTSSPKTEASQIQTKASVVKMEEPGGFTMVGIMAAYEPKLRSFWWRPTPMIAEAGMLESLYQRCKFVMDGVRVVSFCVLGNHVTVLTTQEYSNSLEQGLQKAEAALHANPGLMNGFAGPHDMSFDLQHKSGIDMSTPVGAPPTVVQSVTMTGGGFLLSVSCSCGDGELTLNRNYDFVDFKKKS